jgi:hypothetical protein
MSDYIDPVAPPTGITTEEVIRLLQILNLPAESYAVCGGALLARYGLRINENDLDLLVMPELLGQLLLLWKERGKSRPDSPTIRIDGVRIEAFSSVNFGDDAKAIEYIQRAQITIGNRIPWVRLQDMLDWKRLILQESPQCKRAKEHQRDIDLMEAALR